MTRRYDPDSFGFLIADLSRLMRAEMDRRIAEAGLGLTPGEGRALSHIARAGVVRQAVLAERMGVEAMTASGYLDRLEARGLVERQLDPSDRRAKLVHLTDAAADMLSRLRAIGSAFTDDISASVDPGDWRTMIQALKLARDRMLAMRCEAPTRKGEEP